MGNLDRPLILMNALVNFCTSVLASPSEEFKALFGLRRKVVEAFARDYAEARTLPIYSGMLSFTQQKNHSTALMCLL
jgi:hypothetical protein